MLNSDAVPDKSILDEMKLKGEIEHSPKGYFLRREEWKGDY